VSRPPPKSITNAAQDRPPRRAANNLGNSVNHIIDNRTTNETAPHNNDKQSNHPNQKCPACQQSHKHRGEWRLKSRRQILPRSYWFDDIIHQESQLSKWQIHTNTKIVSICVNQIHCVTRDIVTATLCRKNETCVILNILYSCRFIAVKFSTWYPDDLSY